MLNSEKGSPGSESAMNNHQCAELSRLSDVEEQLRFSDILSRLSTKFVNISAGEVDAEH